MKFDKSYWEEKFINNETGWDIGYVSTPLKDYFDQLTNKDLKMFLLSNGQILQ